MCESVCYKCGEIKSGKYCSHCGHKHEQERLSATFVFEELASTLNFEKGFLFTIRELIFRPGINIRNFLLYDRNRLVRPVVFVLICSLIYAFSQQIFSFEDGYISASSTDSGTATLFMSWITENYGYTNLLITVFCALWLKLFFRRYKYGYFEVLVMLCFVVGVCMLILVLFGILEASTTIRWLDKGAILSTIYVTWAIGQFYEKKRWINYPLALAAYLLGIVSFTLLTVFTGNVIDAIWFT